MLKTLQQIKQLSATVEVKKIQYERELYNLEVVKSAEGIDEVVSEQEGKVIQAESAYDKAVSELLEVINKEI